MPRYFNPSQSRRFYDRFGAKQDKQGFYEDAALAALTRALPLSSSKSVFEFGCGTGRYAQTLLQNQLGSTARYCACDTSATMVDLARARLAPFGPRITVWQSGPQPDFSPGSPPFDVILSTYVLDLLAPDAIYDMLAAAASGLCPGGRLGLVSLTTGKTTLAKLTSRIWRGLANLHPPLVGGCHPIHLADYLDRDIWRLSHHQTVESWTIPSEILVVTRL